METLQDKSTMFNQLETAYQAFEDLLVPLDGWQLTAPRVVGDWSIKEVLIHLTTYHKRLLMLLQAALRETEPEQSLVALTPEEMERLHQQFSAAARASLLSEVWAAFAATHAQVKQAIGALSEPALQDPQRFTWLNGMALQRFIASDTYHHYEDHARDIHSWLAEASPSGA